MGNETILYTYDYPINTSSISDYILLSSYYDKYMVSIDKPNSNVAVTTIFTYYIYPYSYYNYSSTVLRTLTGTLLSACIASDSILFIHSSDGCVYQMSLSGSTAAACHQTNIYDSQDCFYDS